MKKYEVIIREYDTEKVINKHIGTSYFVSTLNLESGKIATESRTNAIHLEEIMSKLQENLEDIKVKKSEKVDGLKEKIIQEYIDKHGKSNVGELKSFLEETEKLADEVDDPFKALKAVIEAKERYEKEFK